MRTVALGLLGLVLAVVVGFGVHLITRDTISLPVVRLDPAPALAPPAATGETSTARTEAEPSPATTERASTATDDGPGRGRGRGRSGGDSGGNSGPGGGDD